VEANRLNRSAAGGKNGGNVPMKRCSRNADDLVAGLFVGQDGVKAGILRPIGNRPGRQQGTLLAQLQTSINEEPNLND
jgi:hypothetical protein